METDPVAFLFTNVQSGDVEVSTDPDYKEGEREMWHMEPLYTGRKTMLLQAVNADLVQRLQSLVGGIEVDLDASLSADGE